MSPERRARARRGEGPLLRDEILRAADALLIETASEEAVSIRAIANRVGVSAPSIYRHFEDKDHLMFAVCERAFGHLADVMEKSVLGLEDPYEAIGRLGETYVEFALAHPEHYRVLFMGQHDGKEATVEDNRLSGEAVEGSRAYNQLAELVERLLADARTRGRDDLPEAAVLTVEIWSTVHGLAALQISFPTMPWPPVHVSIDEHVRGLRSRLG